MTKQLLKNGIFDEISADRRRILKLAVAGMGCATLPTWSAVFAKTIVPGLSVGLGYLASVSQVSRGGYASPKDALIDALNVRVAPGAGMFQLRVVAATNTIPVALDAEYAVGSTHRFWQVWTEQGRNQQSSPIAIRWSAHNGQALPLLVCAGSSSAPTQVPAQAGTYVLAFNAAGQALPSWSSLALRPQPSADESGDMQLLDRASGTPASMPYILLEVETLTT